MRVRHKGKTFDAAGALLWSKAVPVRAEALGRDSQSSWYDHSFRRVPVLGTVDVLAIKSKLFDRTYRPSCGKFGGGTSLGDVWVDPADSSFVFVETIYHIGD
jgi:hypothetical protein